MRGLAVRHSAEFAMRGTAACRPAFRTRRATKDADQPIFDEVNAPTPCSARFVRSSTSATADRFLPFTDTGVPASNPISAAGLFGAFSGELIHATSFFGLVRGIFSAAFGGSVPDIAVARIDVRLGLSTGTLCASRK